MGSYFELSVAKFVLDTSKSLPEYAMVPFQRTDRADPLRHIYEAPAKKVAERLDLLGYSMKAARRSYAKGTGVLDRQARERWPPALLGADAFGVWLAALKTAIDAARNLEHIAGDGTDDPCLRFMLNWEEHFFGFPFADPLLVLRAALDVASDVDAAVLDFDDLVAGGYITDNENLWTLPSRERVIVVTEGKADSRLLRKSFDVLFPEYADFLSFIDFETANAKGGTDELVQFARMLIGCGIRNRIVLLFDNDTAGADAYLRLVAQSLPANVFAMTLPYLPAAAAYPTLGPDGSTIADVNGRACTLELFLGDDCLADDEGGRIPVRWTGFVELRRAYQGQVLRKGDIQKRFESKLAQAERDRGERQRLDFSGIEIIRGALFELLRQR